MSVSMSIHVSPTMGKYSVPIKPFISQNGIKTKKQLP